MLAAFKIRAVPVNVNYRYVEEELRYLFNDADAKAVIFHREFAPKLDAIRDQVPQLAHFVSSRTAPARTSRARRGRLRGCARDLPRAAADFPPRSADDLYILYTGGTTGMPKGVMWRHEDIFFGAFGGGDFAGRADRGAGGDQRQGDRRAHPVPARVPVHARHRALDGLHDAVQRRHRRHLHRPPVRSRAPLEAHRPRARQLPRRSSVTRSPRPLVDALDELDGTVDLAELVVILSGGAILSPTVKTDLAERLPGSMIIDGYGSSEAGGQGQSVTVAGAEPSEGPRFRVNDETTVLTADFAPAPVGVVGKLARRGHIPLGYYKDPEKTAATFPVADGVRWSVPGDDARIEDDGTITLLGRGSVSINTGGEKVYPEEVGVGAQVRPRRDGRDRRRCARRRGGASASSR